MKRIFCYILLSILFKTLSLYAAAPGMHERTFYAYVTVTNQTGNPVAGVEVRLDAWLDGEEGSGHDLDYGATGSDGCVTLITTAACLGDITGSYMKVTVSDENYIVISSSNTESYYLSTLYPEFEVMIDSDKDGIDDNVEAFIAEKFKPVLHKQSYDWQQDLGDFDLILNEQTTLYGSVDDVPFFHLSVPPPFHVEIPITENGWGTGCSFGQGPTFGYWEFNFDDLIRHTGALAGSIPLYYHVYQDESYYYLQYWYFFNMNDLTNETSNHTWHEGDWEHVSLKITKNNPYQPQKINFYQHEGGHTKNPNECWWSLNQQYEL